MPTKTQFAGKLREDQDVSDVFLVVMKQLSSGRTGKSYLRLTLGDRTGRIETRVWEAAEEMSRRFNQGDLVHITGVVTNYQGVLQIKATYVESLDDVSRVDWADFLPASDRPVDEMWAELTALLGTMENSHLKALAEAFLTDPEVSDALRRGPAAMGMHHAYIGGLLEHTLGVVKLAEAVGPLYRADRDLLLTGAFLHDIGKTRELLYEANFDYSDEGRLLGHIVLGLEMIGLKIKAQKDFPTELALHVRHIVASHHGEYEWGSPRRPKTMEALLIHALDNIDAKAAALDRALTEADARGNAWTEISRMFGRPMTRAPEPGRERSEPPAKDAGEPEPGPAREPETMEELLLLEDAGNLEKGGPGGAGQGKLF